VSATNVFSLAVVVLGAGASLRMGRPKLLLPWRDTTILGHTIHQWQSAGITRVCVVHAAGDCAMEAELDRLRVPPERRIINHEPSGGMFSSIKCAACWGGWPADVTHWAISLGDQPHLGFKLLASFVSFSEQHIASVCQPSYRGRPRHPVILPRSDFAALCSAREKMLKEFLDPRPRALLELNDEALDVDIDTPHAYELALKKFSDR
jgi:molybdenum cofactor cytidylyltransferase